MTRKAVAIASELARLGVSRHDVRHEIAVAAKQVWNMMNSGSTFDFESGATLAELRKIIESYR